MSEKTSATNPTQTGVDDNNAKSKGTAIKSRSPLQREKNRHKACAQASALTSTTPIVKPTLSSFVGIDPDLISLDYISNVAVCYGHFKKEMALHAGDRHILLPSVIETGSDVNALLTLAKQTDVPKPSPKVLGNDAAANAVEQDRYDFELYDWRASVNSRKKLNEEFSNTCGRFYSVVVGQLSQLLLYRLETLPDFASKVKGPCNLAKLFDSLDQIILGNKKDTVPFINALNVRFATIATPQCAKMSIPDYNRDFVSQLELLEPAFKDEHQPFRHLISPVLLCVPHFAKELFDKPYNRCSVDEKEEIHLAAKNKIHACLFLLCLRNIQGSSNKELLNECCDIYIYF